MTPVFAQLNLVTGDMDATLAFYRRLGLTIDAEPGAIHAAVELPGGMTVEWDTVGFARQWDTGSRAPGGSTVLGFTVASPQDVDALHADLTGAGYADHQPPYDALWGARFAVVDDPDGNGVAIMGPVDRERAYWPPATPPAAGY